MLHDAQKELEEVMRLDTDVITAHEVMYVVHSMWINQWLRFTFHGGETPGGLFT